MARIRNRSKLRSSSFALPKQRKYPLTDAKHARNALARVQRASPKTRAKVYAAVRRKYPALAKRSRVVPTRGGTGRRHGQRKGATNRRR